MKSSLFTLIITLIIFISYNNNLFLAQQQQSSWQTNDKESKFIVFHKFPQQISYTKRGEVIVVTNKAVSQYIGVNNNVLLHDDVEYSSPFYLIKLVDENDQNNVLKSFTKMCLLRSSNFEDEIIIHLDKHNKPFHFDYYTLKDQCNDTMEVQADKINNEFKTSIQTVRSINGVSPKLHKALPVKEDGTVEKPPEEKSFLQKYWWYLIPFVLLLMTSNPPQPEEGQQQQQQRGQNPRPAR